MELKQFISEALVAIVEGVTEAQKKAEPMGAIINAGGLMRTKTASPDATWDNADNNLARLVNFDVAVTVQDGQTTNAKIGVVSGLLNLGAGGQSDSKHTSVSRIQFSVPILLPSIKKDGARTQRILKSRP